MTLHDSILDVPGILVGQVEDANALTGVSVMIFPKGSTAGVDQRGGAPGTRETDLLYPMHLVEKIHGLVLSGGSAYGLDAASGVMKWLEEHGIGFQTGPAIVPIVPAAVIYDLGLGDPKVRPSADMGYLAASLASNIPIQSGCFGAGCGASVGKLFGTAGAMKSGVGSASVQLSGGVIVAALMVVNAFGDIVDPASQNIIAGTRTIEKGPVSLGNEAYFANTQSMMGTMIGTAILKFAGSQNTVIGVVATNANLNKVEINKVAQMSQDGLARVIRPAHTMFDGDTMFAVSTGKKIADVNTIGAFAANVVERAILNGVRSANPLGGLPSFQDLSATSTK